MRVARLPVQQGAHRVKKEFAAEETGPLLPDQAYRIL